MKPRGVFVHRLDLELGEVARLELRLGLPLRAAHVLRRHDGVVGPALLEGQVADLVHALALESGIPDREDLIEVVDALRILDEDVDYLDALERREEKPALPRGRDTREQRRIHAENLKRLV